MSRPAALSGTVGKTPSVTGANDTRSGAGASVSQLHPGRPPAPAARLRLRHRRLFLGFFLSVLAPIVVSAWYLYFRAADQFSANFAFSVRTEESPTGLSLLGGISAFSALSGSGSSDTDILYDFLHSQTLVTRVDDRLGLVRLWSRPTADPVFSYAPDGSIEDLTEFWQRMVTVAYDPGTRLISVRVFAFEAQDAKQIADTILSESSAMINALSATARADTTDQARAEMALAANRLQQARQSLTALRARTRIVDPIADLQGEMGVLNQLQQLLADELVTLDMLKSTIAAGQGRGSSKDTRVKQSERRINVIRTRLETERQKFGGQAGRDYSALLNEFERLTVEVEFAQQAWLSAVAGYEVARSDARRKTRYLAAHVTPTVAERPLYPKRAVILGVIALFLVLGWGVVTLVAYGLRDRK